MKRRSFLKGVLATLAIGSSGISTAVLAETKETYRIVIGKIDTNGYTFILDGFNNKDVTAYIEAFRAELQVSFNDISKSEADDLLLKYTDDPQFCEVIATTSKTDHTVLKDHYRKVI